MSHDKQTSPFPSIDNSSPPLHSQQVCTCLHANVTPSLPCCHLLPLYLVTVEVQCDVHYDFSSRFFFWNLLNWDWMVTAAFSVSGSSMSMSKSSGTFALDASESQRGHVLRLVFLFTPIGRRLN